MRNTLKHICLFALVLISITVSLTAQSALQIVKKAEEKMQGVKSAQMEMSISIIRPTWRRDLGLKSWSKGTEYNLILITSPAKEAGATFLKRAKEVWNWVPSIERTVKLPPSMMSQSWMGTDLTNDDLVRENSLTKDYDQSIVGDSTIAGRKCFKILLKPKAQAAVVWGKIITFIDKTDYVQMRSEMYDEDGGLVNVMNASNIRTMDGRVVATTLEWIPVAKSGQSTVMQIKSIVFDRAIDDSFFSTQNMKKVSSRH